MIGFTIHANMRSVLTAFLAILFLGLAALDAAAKTHIVRRGESLSGIASKYDVSLDALMEANNLKSRHLVNAGQRLTIPEKAAPKKTTLLPKEKHTVLKGEALSAIATKYGTSVADLVKWNNLEAASRIDAGQQLHVSPPPQPAPEPPPSQTAAPESAAPSKAMHTVKKGETLGQIADRHGVGLSTLAGANKIRWPYRLNIGQKILLPGSASSPEIKTSQPAETIRIIVQKSQTLTDIAGRYGVSEAQIAAYNGLKDPDLLTVGQRLIIPGKDASPKTPIDTGLKAALDRISVPSGKWKYIVVHHTATTDGGWKGMDAYHRKRGMANGLAYHFVIGRGGQMQDGSIHIGSRWRKQLDGGHLAKESLNAKSIGICLVGDFTSQSPTTLQMRSLNGLSDYLLATCRLKPDAVKTHRQIHPDHTACPGKNFPAAHFASELKKRN